MTRYIAKVIAFLCGLYVTAALASYQPGAVVQIPSVAALQGGNYSNTLYLNLANYATAGDGGGGTLFPIAAGCTPDNGVIFADNAGNCFQRIFAGHVLMPWYGVADATTSTCYANTTPFSNCDASAQLNAALAASTLYGDGWVSTGGRSIVVYNTPVQIPSFGGIDCELPQGTLLNQNQGQQLVYHKPNSIVINPDIVTTGIYRSNYSKFQNCVIRPTWMGNQRPQGFTAGSNYIPTNEADMVTLRRLYRGTATTASGGASSMSNVLAVGFDTAVDQSNSGDSYISGMVTDADVHGFIWGQRAGFHVQNWSSAQIAARLMANGVNISTIRWPITAVADDGTGQIKVTVDNTFNSATNCVTFSACMAAGYTVIATGFDNPTTRTQTTGQVTTGSPIITNVPNTQGNGQDGIGAIQVGSTITDAGNAGCVFSGLTVVSIDIDGGLVYLSGNPTSCNPSPTSNNEKLTFISSSSGPAGANTRFLAGTVTTSPNTVVLQGSSYAGPTYTGATWDSGLPTIRIYDVTNVLDGQYLCSSGTAPFCTAPTAYQVPNTQSSDVNSLGNTSAGTGNIHVTSTANWPSTGVLSFPAEGVSCSGKIEYMTYHLQALANKSGYDPTQIEIDTRGWDNTPICLHSNNHAGVIVSAPQVLQAIPNAGNLTETPVVAVNANAQSGEPSGQTVKFLNDNTQTTGLAGQLILNNVYQTYTQNMHTSGGIWGPFVALGDTSNTTPTLLNVTNAFKVQPGMTVSTPDNPNDIPNNTSVTTTGTWGFPATTMTVASATGIFPGMQASGAGIQGDTFVEAVTGTTVTLSHATTVAHSSQTVTFGGVVVTAVSGTTVTLNANAGGTHATQRLAFAGCGYPALSGVPEPWLGNCPGTAILLGSRTDQSSQGTVLDYIHIGQMSAEMLILNAPATLLTNSVYSNGSGKGAQIDSYSTGIYVGGKVSNNDGFENNKIAGANTSLFLDLTDQSSNVKVSDSSFGDSGGIAVGIIGSADSLTLTGDSSADKGVFYYSHMAQNINLAAFMGPQVQVVYDSVAAQNPVAITCAGNTFVTLYCGDSIGLAIGSPTSGEIFGAINTQTGAFKNGVEYSNITTSTFTPTGGNTATTLPDFATRHLSLLDFGGIPDGSTDATTALTNAFATALAQNVHEIWADGKNGVGATYKISTLTIPAGIILKCPNTLPASDPANDYRNKPGFVVTNNHGFAMSSGSGIQGCYIIQNLLNAAPPTTLQGLHTRQVGYAGIGVNCLADPCYLSDDMILGFDQPVLSKLARTAFFHKLQIDGNYGINIPSQGGGGIIDVSGVEVNSYGTAANTLAISTFNISSIQDNGAGELQVTLSASCSTANCPLNTYLASVIQPPSAQSALGEHTLENGTATTFDLAGTTSAFLTGGYGQTATTTSGSTLITGFTTHLDQYHPTQNVTGATCIPAGAQIAAFFFWNGHGFMYLDSAHPATCTVTETVTTADDAGTNVGVTTATINVPGTCYTIGDLVTVVGGSLAAGGNAAVLSVQTITPDIGCTDPTTGTPTKLGISDPGLYTMLPGAGASTTGGTGTGLTVDVSSVAQLVVNTDMRYQPALNIASVNDVKVRGFKELYHSPGMMTSGNANGVDVDECDLHDNNYDQSRRIGLYISGFTKASNFKCNVFYAGVALLDDATAPTLLAANTFTGFLGGSSGATGQNQNELFELHSSTLGTTSHSGMILQDIYTKVSGVAFIGDDMGGTTMNGVRAPLTTLYPQSGTTAANVSGAGNLLASGSMPIYSASAVSQLAPGIQNAGNGSTLLTNATNTFIEGVQGSLLIDSGALTNDRVLVLSNTSATGGYTVTLSRHGSSGGHNRVVKQSDGTTTIATIADGAVATFYFDPNSNLWVQL